MKVIVVLWLLLMHSALLQGDNLMNITNAKMNKTPLVYKYVLENGMTILVRPLHIVPKVSIQLWYHVGSKDEKDNERGIAHLIEHMIFKGTAKLAESDIDTIIHKLSGSCNAFTSYDYTGYLFNLPSQHWQESFTIMADCMENCSFKDYMLNSEMKAVIQELKLYRDRYERSLVDEMIGLIFHDHPYHHPVIGYKQDLWSVTSKDLKKFYKEHYMPNNATLVVVGDVDPQEVYKLAQDKFGHIKANLSYKKQDYYFNKDIVAKSVTLYRDIKQPVVLFSFVVPGIRSKKDNVLELIATIIGKGKGSRLYKKLVNELHLATSLTTSSDELFDHGIFFIMVEPKHSDDIPAIEQHIIAEIERLKEKGISDAELTRAIKKTEMSIHSLMEDIEHQAYEIGKYYLATGDENYIFNYLHQPKEQLKKDIHELLSLYFRPTVMHKGAIMPLPEKEKPSWALLQKESDRHDQQILSARERVEPIEPPRQAAHVEVKEPQLFLYPKPTIFETSNGLKVFAFHNPTTPKIDIVLDLKAKHYFDPDDKQGLLLFVSKMMLEGTKNYAAAELIDAIESRGMSISTYPGGISLSLLADDLEYGLSLMKEILTKALFDEKEIEKVRAQLIANLKNFWDEPRHFSGQLVREHMYKDHPYSKNSFGTLETMSKISRQDLIDCYKKYISPHGARIAIVGDLGAHDVKAVVKKTLGSWKGEQIPDIEFPHLKSPSEHTIDYHINRDQVVLRFAAQSIPRKHADYDKLLLFDQIFGGGFLGSMHSRLFQLREQSGLFYTIGGSLIAGADEQPGMLLVQTIVSLDRLAEAEKEIRKAIQNAADGVHPEEFKEAQRAILNAQVDNFSSNYSIANVFLFLDRYKFPHDFFDQRAAALENISLEDMTAAVRSTLKSKLLMVRVGRVQPERQERPHEINQQTN